MSPAPDPSKIPKSQRRSTEAAVIEYVNLLNDSVKAGFDRVAVAQEKTELALAQLTVQVKSTSNNIDKLGEKLDKFGDRFESNIDRLGGKLDQFGDRMDKLGDRLDRMGDRIDGHLQVAREQSANISELTKLVATQARTVEILISRAS